MKNKIKMTTIALFIAFGVVFALASYANNLVEAQTKKASSRSLYVQNCARCHGADGKGETVLGKKLGADDISGGESTTKVIRSVTNGRGDMPSFKKKLTTGQIASVARYVHSL
ncbi:MAG: c-type cytochrome [Pyrinomonadaceae bacterium]